MTTTTTPAAPPTDPNLSPTGRWAEVSRAQATDKRCRYCGRSGPDCPPITCLACGVRQCDRSTKDGRVECAVCFVGLLRLPMWRGLTYGAPTCRYVRCEGSPVVAQGKYFVCAGHLGRASRRMRGVKITVEQDVRRALEQLARKNHTINGWRRFVWMEPPTD